MSTLTWAVVAAEDEPARAEWLQAAHEADVAEPRFVPWSAVLSPEAEFQAGEVVLAQRLHPRTAENPVGGHHARYLELRTALEQLESLVTKAGAVLATPAEPALLALDRTKRDDFLRQNGVPLLDPPDPDTTDGTGTLLRPRYAGSDDWMIDGWRTQLFRHRTRDGFEVWRAPGGVHGDRDEIGEIAAALADDGIHTVTALHRVYLSSSFYDIRFAVVDGKATHAAGVARETFVPREWYGGKRSEFDVFLSRFGVERWSGWCSSRSAPPRTSPGSGRWVWT